MTFYFLFLVLTSFFSNATEDLNSFFLRKEQAVNRLCEQLKDDHQPKEKVHDCEQSVFDACNSGLYTSHCSDGFGSDSDCGCSSQESKLRKEYSGTIFPEGKSILDREVAEFVCFTTASLRYAYQTNYEIDTESIWQYIVSPSTGTMNIWPLFDASRVINSERCRFDNSFECPYFGDIRSRPWYRSASNLIQKDVVILLDVTGSMSYKYELSTEQPKGFYDRNDVAISSIEKILDDLSIFDKVSLLFFTNDVIWCNDERARVAMPVTMKTREILKSCLEESKGLLGGYSNNYQEPFEIALDILGNVENVNSEKIILLFTDAVPIGSNSTNLLKLTQNKDVSIFPHTIGGENDNFFFYRNLACSNRGEWKHADESKLKFDEVRDFFSKYVDFFSNYPTTSTIFRWSEISEDLFGLGQITTVSSLCFFNDDEFYVIGMDVKIEEFENVTLSINDDLNDLFLRRSRESTDFPSIQRYSPEKLENLRKSQKCNSKEEVPAWVVISIFLVSANIIFCLFFVCVLCFLKVFVRFFIKRNKARVSNQLDIEMVEKETIINNNKGNEEIQQPKLEVGEVPDAPDIESYQYIEERSSVYKNKQKLSESKADIPLNAEIELKDIPAQESPSEEQESSDEESVTESETGSQENTSEEQESGVGSGEEVTESETEDEVSGGERADWKETVENNH